MRKKGDLEFTNLNVQHNNGEDVTGFGLCQLGTHTDKVYMLNPTKLGTEEKDDASRSVVDDNKMKTRMKFSDIVRGNQYPKSVARFKPVMPAQKKHVLQNNQVMRFTLAWWNP